MTQSPSQVLPHALDLPIFSYLKDKRAVLASASPRRKELLEASGLKPDIIPSTFAEDLPHDAYANALAEYPIHTGREKGKEVYERLMKEDKAHAPALVISADTVVIYPAQSNLGCGKENTTTAAKSHVPSKILEKPVDKNGQLRTLTELNGKECEIITGVTILYPTKASPGFDQKSMAASTLVKFNSNSREALEAYVKNGEGIDRAGGFAAQGLGGILVESVQGDYNNVAGFPTYPFWRWLNGLYEEGAFDE